MLRKFIPQSLRFPGHLGVQILRPTSAASPEWIVVIKFQSRGAYDGFRNSPEYQRWTAEIRGLLESDPVVEERCGLESWFVLPGATDQPVLPRWKMALVTWIGVNVAVIGLAMLLLSSRGLLADDPADAVCERPGGRVVDVGDHAAAHPPVSAVALSAGRARHFGGLESGGNP